jgi:hypothetical protein
MVARQIIRGELGRHPAPAERQAGADHRDLGARVAERAQQVWEQACQAEADQHERDRQLLGGVAVAARRSEDAGADHPHHDRSHGHVLVFAGVLAQHPLGEEHEHQQPGRERRLDDDEGGEKQRDHLQRPAEDREARAEQPAGPPDQSPDEGEAQMLVVGRLLGIHRLERYP